MPVSNLQYSGTFISVEGGEGVGKTLFCQGLAAQLTALGWQVRQTREPGGTKIAQKIREIFLDPPAGEALTALSELFLVSAARVQHLEQVIKPALVDRGNMVPCDRFVDSTRVYQGTLGGLDSGRIESVIAASVGDLLPATTFVLDCPEEIAWERVRGRVGDLPNQEGKQKQQAASAAQLNRYDGGTLAFYGRLRQAYLDLAARFPARIKILRSDQPPEKVVEDALAHLQSQGIPKLR